MKKIFALFALLWWPFQWLGRLIRGLLAMIFGPMHFTWAPPAWLGALGWNPRVGVVVVLAASGTAWGSWQWRQWQEAHKPRPREVVATRQVEAAIPASEVPTWDAKRGKLIPQTVVVRFDYDVAPLEKISKPEPAKAAQLDPVHPGQWTWNSPRTLVFTPESPLPSGQEYAVKIDPAGLVQKITLKADTVKFTTPRLKGEFTKSEFYTDPTNGSTHQAVFTVRFNQPVLRDDLVRALKVDAIGGPALFVDATAPEVIADKDDSTRVFHIRSAKIRIPVAEDFARATVDRSLKPMCGGMTMPTEPAEKVVAPTRESAFRITDAGAQIVPNEEGEPRQFLFIKSKRPATPAQMAKAVEVWSLPEKEDEAEWKLNEVTDEVLAKAKAVKPELVEEDSGSPISESFAFRLPPTEEGPVFVRIKKGMEAAGGFVLGQEFRSLVEVPGFPKEARILGKGGVLALSGERKLNVKSRGFDHLRYTLARVPAVQLNHLVSQTEGKFEALEFQSSAFGIEDLARFHQSVQPIAKKNDYEANYSAFDFGPALVRPDATDTDPNRGLYFLKIDGVRKHTDDDPAASKDDPDPDWVVLDGKGEDVKWDNESSNGSSEGRFILLTDLGLLVKRNADGTRDLFVQSFKQRAPVNQVRIVALAKNGDTLAESTTDASGHAVLPALDGLKRERKAVAILARKGNDLAFLPWARDDRAVELSRFEIDGIKASEKGALDAFLFTERGVYRPGDSIHLAAMVRTRDWAGPVAGVPVEAVVINVKEEEVGRYPAVLPPDGFLDFTIPTLETAPTGVWRLELQRPAAKKAKKKAAHDDDGDDEEDGARGDSTHLGHLLVRVEDFQPDRMKMQTSWSPASPGGWLAPQTLSAKVDLQTLFGTAATDRRVTAKLRVSAANAEFPGWSKWHFHLPEAKPFESVETDLGEKKSDAQGTAAFEFDLKKYAAPLLRVSVELEGFEPDGARGVRGALSALVSPNERLLGWRADEDLNFIPCDVAREVHVVALSPELKPTVAEKLTRVLLEMRHTSVLTKQDNGSLAYVSREQTKEIERLDMSLPAEDSRLALPVSRAGRFRYEWRNAGGTLLCAVPFNVVGPGGSDRNLERDAELEMTLPDREWKAGEPLEVSLRAPYTGAGLMTVEREKVLSWKWFKADTAESVQHIDVPAGLEGGAYVNVAFVRGMDSEEIFTNPLSTGVSPFKVSPARRSLAVELEAPARVRPGESLRIGFRTPKRARIAVWAVDEGIHRVTNYRAPQPIGFFFRKPTLEVGTWQLLDVLLPEYSLLQKSTRAFGGDGDEPPELKLGLNPFKRHRAAPVVYWSGLVESGPERREVIYQVPEDFAGTLNLFAAAVADDSVGVAEAKTLVKGPFVLTPSVPFFAVPGDEFVASLAIANQLEGAAATDRVTVKLAASPQLEVLDAPSEAVAVPVGTEKTIRVRVRVKDGLGNAELKFSAAAGDEEVALKSTLSVRPATQYVTEVQSGYFRQPSIDIPVGREVFPEFVRVEAVASPTPLGYVHGLEAYLRQYPHGCAEQITSKAFPWLLLSDESNFGLSRGEADKVIADTCRMLATRQRGDGGFGYWSRADGVEGFDFLTIYVGHFLTEAKASGFVVPEPLLAGTLSRLKLMAALPVHTREEGTLQAASIYLLTRSGEVTTNYALNLTDTLDRLAKDKWDRDLSAAWIAATWSLLKKEPEAEALIARFRTARAQPAPPRRGEWYYYETRLTESAQALAILCRHFPKIAGALNYEDLKSITEPIERGEFHTLSAAWTILALKSYAGLVKDSGVKLGIEEVVNGLPKSLVTPRGSLTSAKFTTQAKAVRFLLNRPEGAPDVGAWYQTVEVGFPKALPTVGETRGLEIIREFVNDKNEVVTTAKVGETLLLRLRVRNANGNGQSHVALVDLLPGGFDNAPGALRPGLNALPGANYVDVREDRNLIFTDFAAGQTRTFQWRVRPISAGTFTVPPAFAEAMYDRGIHGSSAAGKFTVVARE